MATLAQAPQEGKGDLYKMRADAKGTPAQRGLWGETAKAEGKGRVPMGRPASIFLCVHRRRGLPESTQWGVGPPPHASEA